MRDARSPSELECRIGYTFQDESLLKTALTHSSYANEKEGEVSESYERLEFLGDAVMGLAVAYMIFQKVPRLTEGQMTAVRAAVVSSESLASIARSIDLSAYLRVGVGAGRCKVHEHDAILEDALEALIAAVFVDGGVDAVRDMVYMLFMEPLGKAFRSFSDKNLLMDYKSRLQVELQRDGVAHIQYIVKGESGPEHDKRFLVSVACEGRELGIGEGKTKKEAEKMAAKVALEELACI